MYEFCLSLWYIIVIIGLKKAVDGNLASAYGLTGAILVKIQANRGPPKCVE